MENPNWLEVEMQQYFEHKWSKALVKLEAEQLLEEVKKVTYNKEMELSLLMDKLTDSMTSTPKCHNRMLASTKQAS